MSRGVVRPPWSLAVRLGWRLGAVMLVTLLLAAAAVGWRAIATVHELDDSALQSQVRLIAARLPPVANADRLDLPDDLVTPFRASDGDNVFLVHGPGGLSATSDPDAAGHLAPFLPSQPEFFRVPALAGHPHGMIGLAAQAGLWRVVVLQGREQTALLLDSLMGGFVLAGLWLLLPIGAAMIGVAVFTLRRGLRPLRHASAAAALVGPGRPEARLPTAGLPAEVAPLVHAMNEALARLEQALVVQRRFVAEAAHALRTPLAVLTARLDVLGDVPDIEALRHDTERMARLVGQLLRMARLEGLPLDLSQQVDLHDVAVSVIAALVPLGLRQGVEIALSEQKVAPVRGNRSALELALGNLVENALAHAPAGCAVDVEISAPATMAVLDRGPGVAPADRARIFERFERGLGAREGGAGLGLAIVAEIAAAHGGVVRMGDRAGGGAVFAIVLDHADRRTARP